MLCMVRERRQDSCGDSGPPHVMASSAENREKDLDARRRISGEL